MEYTYLSFPLIKGKNVAVLGVCRAAVGREDGRHWWLAAPRLLTVIDNN